MQWTQDITNNATITISQATSHPSVSFFQVPLALTFKNAIQEKTIIVQHTLNNQIVIDNLGFKADTVLIDPDMQLISKNNKTVHNFSTLPIEITAVTVSPNPFTDRINVSIKESAGKKILMQLFDNAGHIIVSNSVTGSINDQKSTLTVRRNIPPGSYILRITVDEKVTVHNVIKK